MSDESSATVEILTADPAEAPLPQPEGLAHSSSPVDLPPPDEPLPHPLRWTSMVIAVATILLALLNATAIRAWAYQLPANPVADRVVVAAEGWYGFTESLGLNRPVETMHGWWQRAEALTLPPGFAGRAPPSPQMGEGQNEEQPGRVAE